LKAIGPPTTRAQSRPEAVARQQHPEYLRLAAGCLVVALVR
jgi:hypothetical protein